MRKSDPVDQILTANSAPNLHETLLQMVTAFWTSRTLQVVAEAGVADALGDEPLTAEHLASATGTNSSALFRVLRQLASHGIFEALDGKWIHTESSRLLRKDHPQSLRDFLRMMGMPMVWQSWGAMDDSLRTGEPGTKKLDEQGMFSYLAKHPEESSVFNSAMAAKAQRDIPAILAAYDFTQFKTIADIGGGRGHLLRAVLDSAQHANGILFDQPHVIAEAPPHPRLAVVDGDFFGCTMPTADAYLLMDILHDWSDAYSARILAGLRRAAIVGATLLIVETVIPNTAEPHLAKLLDLNMLIMTGGKERTEEAHRTLLYEAGFRLNRIVRTQSPYSIVEAVAV